ncbi:hypothetical protein ACJX0J_024955, partial [Zea mays]
WKIGVLKHELFLKIAGICFKKNRSLTFVDFFKDILEEMKREEKRKEIATQFSPTFICFVLLIYHSLLSKAYLTLLWFLGVFIFFFHIMAIVLKDHGIILFPIKTGYRYIKKKKRLPKTLQQKFHNYFVSRDVKGLTLSRVR